MQPREKRERIYYLMSPQEVPGSVGLCSSTSSSLLRLVAPRLPPGRLGLDRRPCGIGASDAGGSGAAAAPPAGSMRRGGGVRGGPCDFVFFFTLLSRTYLFLDCLLRLFFYAQKICTYFFYIGANTYLLIGLKKN